MKKTLFLTGLFTILLFACMNDSEPTHHESTIETHEHDGHHHEAEKSEQSGMVSLNNGEKWGANAETTEGIREMSKLVEELPEDPQESECSTLKTNMQAEFNQILQKCTMTGEAHNQLHNYLLPMKQLIEKLDTDCKNSSEQLKEHLAEYQNYFQ